MPHPQLDRNRLKVKSLAERENRVHIESDQVSTDSQPLDLSEEAGSIVRETVKRIRSARDKKLSVMLVFGAHSIKNGLAPVLIKLMKDGWVTHMATNGAGIIHDWEFAFQGATSEDVKKYVEQGQFGIWQETGYYINLALAVGAWRGLGYGESVGEMILNDSLEIPGQDDLRKAVVDKLDSAPDESAAAADLLSLIRRLNVKQGKLVVKHPFKKYSVQAAARQLGVPFTAHPMIGHDIIYTHPANVGAAVGRTAIRDFLAFAHSVSRLDGGVYLSVGSSVMSPMVFEKSLSMARNLAMQEGRNITNHFMAIVDLARAPQQWDGCGGEPNEGDATYYLRFQKTFRRMGGTLRYASADNRDFLLALLHELQKTA